MLPPTSTSSRLPRALAVACLFVALQAPSGPQPSSAAAPATSSPTLPPGPGARALSSPTPPPGSGARVTPSPTPPPDLAALAAARSREASAPVVGVNADLTQYDDRRLYALVDRLDKALVKAVRQPVRWSDLEPVRGQVDWRPLDRLVESLAQRKIRLVASLESSPAWARHDPPSPDWLTLCRDPSAVDPAKADAAPPTDPADLASFAGQLVERYRGRVWAVEVWPEPNLLPNWRRTGPAPEDYARLLQATADAVRRTAPEVLVVSGGLAPTTDVSICYLSDLVFLDRLARSGVLAAVDAVGIEPLGLRSGPEDRATGRDDLNFARATSHQRILSQYAVERPLWAMAWGWNALPGDWTGRPSPWGSHPPDVAADWIREGWARARGQWPWLASMFAWHLQPHAPADDPVWGFAMWGRDDQPTALWGAIQDLGAGRLPTVAGPTSGGATGRPGELTPGMPFSLPPLGLALGLVVLAVLGLMLALRRPIRRPLAASGRRVLEPVGRLTDAQAGLLYLLAALASVAPIWPLSLLGLPVQLLLAVTHPDVALAAVAAGAPLYFGLSMHLGPRRIGLVEGLVAVAAAGRLARWYLGLEAEGMRQQDSDWPDGSGSDRRGDPADSMDSHALDGRGFDRRKGKRRWPRLDWHPLDWAALCLLVWSAASLGWSEYRGVALREWRTVMLEPAVFYLLLRSSRDRARSARLALHGLLFGGVMVSSWALGDLARCGILRDCTAVVRTEGVLRLRGPYGSPNNLALALGRILPLLAAFLVWGKREWRLGYGLAALPIGLALFGTFSRGTLLIGVPTTAAVLLMAYAVGGRTRPGRPSWRLRRRPRARWIVLGAAGCVLAAALVLPLARTERFQGGFRAQPGSTLFIRLHVWGAAAEMIRDHPLLGIGLDNFLPNYRDRYVHREVMAEEPALNHPHNLFLDWWVRLGLPGLVLLLVLGFGNLALGWRNLRGKRRLRGRGRSIEEIEEGAVPPTPHGRIDLLWPMAVAALGMQAYALAHGMVDNMFFLVDLAVVWWLAQAAGLAAGEGTQVIEGADSETT